MLLINCAACTAPLAHDAPRCVRCKTRYCNSTCQHDHWRRGHKQICKKIHRGGNAEQYHADKKYKEALKVAVEACAEDAKGQTCFICLESIEHYSREGLVRGCACRGTAGFAHVSCLVRQERTESETRVEETKSFEDIGTLTSCKLCEKHYNAVVLLALGWAFWKKYAGKPEDDMYGGALANLALCLSGADYEAEAKHVVMAFKLVVEAGQASDL